MSLIASDLYSFSGWVAVGLFAAVLSYFGCLRAMKLAQSKGMIAQPGARQSHFVATATGGGLGLIFSIVVTSVCLQLFNPLPGFWWQNMLPGIWLLTIVGWRDDRLPVSSLTRLLVQLAVSIWLLGFGRSELAVGDLAYLAITALAMVWMMNLYNFMDGSNGMAGFQGLFAGVLMAIFFQAGEQYAMALVSLVTAAACVGFLPLNFPQARVFMGDVASVPLGFIFACFAVYGFQTGSLSLPVCVLIMSVFIVDSTLTLFARVFRGERWYTAHAQHVYQRLIAHGWSHSRVLMSYQAINVGLILPAIVLAKTYPQYAIVTVCFTLLLLGACWHIANWRLGVIATEQLK